MQYQKMHIDRLEAYSRDDDSHALVVEVIGVAAPNEPPLVERRLTAFPLAVRARVASWTVPNEDGVAVAVDVQGASILHETLHNNVNSWLGEAPGWDGNCGGCQSLARLRVQLTREKVEHEIRVTRQFTRGTPASRSWNRSRPPRALSCWRRRS